MFPISLRSCLVARGLPWQGVGVCGCHRGAELPPEPCRCLHRARDAQQRLQVQSSCALSGESLELSLESTFQNWPRWWPLPTAKLLAPHLCVENFELCLHLGLC